MPLEQTPEFGKLVFGKTITNTKRFFASILRDVLLGVACLFIGFGLFWYLRGLPNAMEQALSVIAFTLAPLGALVIVVFFWNLWLAPCELAYQALEQKAKLSGHASYSTPNYDVWKQRHVYTISEFASLLDNSDPESGYIFLIFKRSVDKIAKGTRHTRDA